MPSPSSRATIVSKPSAAAVGTNPTILPKSPVLQSQPHLQQKKTPQQQSMASNTSIPCSILLSSQTSLPASSNVCFKNQSLSSVNMKNAQSNSGTPATNGNISNFFGFSSCSITYSCRCNILVLNQILITISTLYSTSPNVPLLLLHYSKTISQRSYYCTTEKGNFIFHCYFTIILTTVTCIHTGYVSKSIYLSYLAPILRL